jgi:transposase
MTEKLFETTLAISAPWFVTGTDLNARVRTLTIRVDFAPGSRFAAPGVAGEHPVHNTVAKR